MSFPNWVVDRRGSVVVEYEVGHFVYPNDGPDEPQQYDFRSDAEEIESDEWFETIDEAEDTIVRRLGGR